MVFKVKLHSDDLKVEIGGLNYLSHRFPRFKKVNTLSCRIFQPVQLGLTYLIK